MIEVKDSRVTLPAQFIGWNLIFGNVHRILLEMPDFLNGTFINIVIALVVTLFKLCFAKFLIEYQMTLLENGREDRNTGDVKSAFRLAELNDEALK
jgi:hypothetical protein